MRGQLSILVSITVSSFAMFKKPMGFSEDSSHTLFFRRLDIDRDGLLSDSEMLSIPGMSNEILRYIYERRRLSESKTPMVGNQTIPGLTLADFMWFYRESDMFVESPLPERPSQLYSFPSWPGMKSKPCAQKPADISPFEFWQDFVVPHRALVIRGALNGSLAMSKWSDPDYLTRSFGDIEAKIESRYEGRGDSRSKVSRSRAKVSDIVNGELDGYVVSVVPQKMAWEVNVPHAVLCGSRERSYLDLESPELGLFMTELEETSLWISRGSTRSQFHYDKENTMNCLVTGEPKQWVILDTRKYGRLMPWVRGGGYDNDNDMDNRYTDWVGINVDELDLNLHKYLTEVEFEVVVQYPGDCVFLPYSMLHYAGHLTDDPTKLQVAVSFMWLPTTTFNRENCKVSSSMKTVPLAVFDTVWYYSGHGAIPQGHYDPRQLEDALLRNHQGWSPQNILGFLPPRNGNDGMEYVLATMKNLSVIVNSCRKRFIDDQVCPVPVDLWLHLSTAADLNQLGCNANLTYIPRPLSEMNRMLEFLDQFS